MFLAATKTRIDFELQEQLPQPQPPQQQNLYQIEYHVAIWCNEASVYAYTLGSWVVGHHIVRSKALMSLWPERWVTAWRDIPACWPGCWAKHLEAGNPLEQLIQSTDINGTPQKFNSSPMKSYIPKPNRKVVFQPPFFRGYVSFREGN